MEKSKQIWDAMTEGEEAAFRQLIISHYAELYNYGVRFTKDSELVKDTIQDLFLVLWNRRGSLSRPENIKAYLFSSLRRMVFRKVKSHKKTHNEIEIDHGFDLQVSIETQYIRDETARRRTEKIAMAIDRLPSRQKELVFLKFYHGFNRNEIAEAMDITPQTVSNLMQIALGKLKTDFGQSFDPNILYIIVPLLLNKLL